MTIITSLDNQKIRPNIIAVIAMYRKERGWTYTVARDVAIREYRKRGWDIPESVERLEGRPPIAEVKKPKKL